MATKCLNCGQEVDFTVTNLGDKHRPTSGKCPNCGKMQQLAAPGVQLRASKTNKKTKKEVPYEKEEEDTKNIEDDEDKSWYYDEAEEVFDKSYFCKGPKLKKSSSNPFLKKAESGIAETKSSDKPLLENDPANGNMAQRKRIKLPSDDPLAHTQNKEPENVRGREGMSNPFVKKSLKTNPFITKTAKHLIKDEIEDFMDYSPVDREEYRHAPTGRELIPGYAEWEDREVDHYYDGWVNDHIRNSGGMIVGSNNDKIMNLKDGEHEHAPKYPEEALTESLLEARHNFLPKKTKQAKSNPFTKEAGIVGTGVKFFASEIANAIAQYGLNHPKANRIINQKKTGLINSIITELEKTVSAITARNEAIKIVNKNITTNPDAIPTIVEQYKKRMEDEPKLCNDTQVSAKFNPFVKVSQSKDFEPPTRESEIARLSNDPKAMEFIKQRLIERGGTIEPEDSNEIIVRKFFDDVDKKGTTKFQDESRGPKDLGTIAKKKR